MTTRDLYLNILEREPDIEAITKYGCVERLPTNIFLRLQTQLENSPEYKCMNIIPSKNIVEGVRNIYMKEMGNIDGGGVYHHSKLIAAGFESFEHLQQELQLEYKQMFTTSIYTTINWTQSFNYKYANYYHLVSKYQPDDNETLNRIALASDTWRSNYTETFVPAYIQSDNRLPIFNELINKCIETYDITDSKYIVYSNADILFCNDFEKDLNNTVGLSKWPMFSFRRDFHSIPQCLDKSNIMNKGKWFSGVDLFIIPVQWWKSYSHKMPPMYIGKPYWDLVLRHVISNSNESVDYKIAKQWDIPGLNAHIIHSNNGFQNSIEKTHNKKMAIQYFKSHNIPTVFIF